MFHHSIKSGWEAALLTMAILLVPSMAQASAIQSQPPEKIFAAACSTCHGAGGRGGRSWVNSVSAPRIAGLRMISDTAAKNMIRNGSDNRGMPGFGPAEMLAPIAVLLGICAVGFGVGFAVLSKAD